MGDMSVNYREVQLPEDKDPSDYSYQERRADILQNYLLNAGHPDEVNWSELARYYDKSKSTIHNDKQTLLEYLTEAFDPDRVKQIGMSLFESGLLEISADDDYDPFDEVAFYQKWIHTLDKLGFIDLDDEDDAEDLFLDPDEGGITVEIAGVSGEDVDLSGMPEQDRPDADPDEEETEVVEA